jgi:4-amino-4-deoxy-L-arabinose transferase-like glycosyltransferase
VYPHTLAFRVWVCLQRGSLNVIAALREKLHEPSTAELLSRLSRRASLLIFVMAFVLRAAMLVVQPESKILYGRLSPEGLRSGDEGINIAVSLARSGEFADPFSLPTGPTAHVPPLFPAITALIFYIFGTQLAGGLARDLLTITGYALTFAFMPRMARLLRLGRNTGILAGAVCACFPFFRSSEVFTGRDEWLAALLLMCLTAVAFELTVRVRWKLALAYAAGWSLILYVQPATIPVFLVQAALLVALGDRAARAARIRVCAFTLVAMVICASPWVVRNRRRLGGWTLMRDNFGLELRVSNGDGAMGAQFQNQESGRFRLVHPMSSQTVARRVQELGELQFNRECLRIALDWIRNHPGRFLRLSAVRTFYFWMDVPAWNLAFLGRMMVSVAALLGFVRMWAEGRRRQVLLVAGVLCAYWPVYAVVQYSIRYVAPILFALFLPAAYWAVRRLATSARPDAWATAADPRSAPATSITG